MDKFKAQLAQLAEKVAKLSRSQRIAIVVAVLVLIGGGFTYFSYLPQTKKLTTLKSDLEEVERQLTIARTKATKLPELRKKQQEMELAFLKAKQSLPTGKEIPQLLQDISSYGRQAGLEFHLFQPKGETPMEFYAEIPIEVKVQGGYHEIAKFFDKVSRMDRIVNFQNLKIAPAQEGEWEKLMATCTAVTYRFVGADETGKS
ncbi:MAG: type 4a pilus biogenesis protein PilO [Deltaproteobacteria bacterium]|nr:type 4a pilus biogenesis protein PilO [Deltaproteobacteria bacterium]